MQRLRRIHLWRRELISRSSGMPLFRFRDLYGRLRSEPESGSIPLQSLIRRRRQSSVIITSLIFDETLHMADHRDAVMLFCDSDKSLELLATVAAMGFSMRFPSDSTADERHILSRTWVSRLAQISDLRERYFRSLETLFLISNWTYRQTRGHRRRSAGDARREAPVEGVSLKIACYREDLRVVSYRVMLDVPQGTGLVRCPGPELGHDLTVAGVAGR